MPAIISQSHQLGRKNTNTSKTRIPASCNLPHVVPRVSKALKRFMKRLPPVNREYYKEELVRRVRESSENRATCKARRAADGSHSRKAEQSYW
jgi:hypothetical protein